MASSQTSSHLSQNRPHRQKILDRVSASSPEAVHTIPTVSVAVLPALKQNIINRSLLDSMKIQFYYATFNKNVPRTTLFTLMQLCTKVQT
jgi:hypothetical protein